MSLPELRVVDGGFVADCPVCVLAGGVVATQAEALNGAGAHDDGVHGGRPTTEVRPVGTPVPGSVLGGLVVVDLESTDRDLTVREHLFVPDRLVVAVAAGDEDTGTSLAVALSAASVRVVRDALTAWLAQSPRPGAAMTALLPRGECVDGHDTPTVKAVS